jgi:hypothetical protein
MHLREDDWEQISPVQIRLREDFIHPKKANVKPG